MLLQPGSLHWGAEARWSVEELKRKGAAWAAQMEQLREQRQALLAASVHGIESACVGCRCDSLQAAWPPQRPSPHHRVDPGGPHPVAGHGGDGDEEA